MEKTHQDEVKPPSLFWLLLEGRAVYELATTALVKPLLRKAPQGDGHPVLVLPGFVASDVSTRPLRRFLKEQGYGAHAWRLGRNLGLRNGLEERIFGRVRELRERYDRKVSLVGWSLGGVFAREVAALEPEHVRSVITLGSPYNANPKANHSWRAFEWLSGRKIDDIDPARVERLRGPLPVPTTSIYSRQDGITNWRCCVEEESSRAESIGVPGSHCGLGVNPLVLYAIADRLAQPEGHWLPFERSGLRRWAYRRPEPENGATGPQPDVETA
jgi:alpha/beta hydrolase fold